MGQIKIDNLSCENMSKEQFDDWMIGSSIHFGHFHVALLFKKDKSVLETYNEFPEYVLVKGFEFKKAGVVKHTESRRLFVQYQAVSLPKYSCWNVFIRLNRTQFHPTRLLTIKY
jgi:hypothetical protein